MATSPVQDLLHRRRATRAILSDPLPDDTIADLIEAIRFTPSCFNNQPWRFIFATSDEGRRKAANAFTGGNVKWAPRAPLIVIGYAKASDDCQPKDGRQYHLFDTGMSTMNLMLEATHLGLVARPMAGFNPTVLRDEFEFDDDDEIIVMLSIGKPGDDESHVPDSYKGIEERPRERNEPELFVRHA